MKIRQLTNSLKLTNDGQLSIFPIGVGTAFSRKNYQNNYLLIKNDQHLLIDCGTLAPLVLEKLGVQLVDIENFYITHLHADHIGGLEESMLMHRYVKKTKANIIITKEFQKLLWNLSLRGGSAPNEQNNGLYLNFSDFWNIHRPSRSNLLKRDAWEIDFAGFNLVFFRTMHYPDSSNSWKDSFFSTGLIIDKRVLFTADTRFDWELVHNVTEVFNIELIFHDIQFFPGGIHAYFDDLCTLSEDLRKKIVFMHYPDDFMKYRQKLRDWNFQGFVQLHNYYDFTD